jgi:hypothetical protein
MKIALMGYARTGKDTVAQIIQELCPPTVTMAFADKMKLLFHTTFPHVPSVPKPREGYEKFGKYTREIDPTVWINHLERQYKCWEKTDVNIVITDVRQPNEAAWAKENGFYLVNVVAKDGFRTERSAGETGFELVNNSERELWMVDYDWLIPNNGTRDELERKVAHMITTIGGERDE